MKTMTERLSEAGDALTAWEKAPPTPIPPHIDGAMLAVVHLRRTADFNRSWTDGRLGPKPRDSEAYTARRREAADLFDRMADQVTRLFEVGTTPQEQTTPWLPIATAPIGCGVDRGLTIDGRAWTSETLWVRDADGRVYEAWFVEAGEYWWDADGETVGDPVEWMPHPLWRSDEGGHDHVG